MLAPALLAALALLASCGDGSIGGVKKALRHQRQDAARTRTDLGQYMQQGKLEIDAREPQQDAGIRFESDAHTVIAVLYDRSTIRPKTAKRTTDAPPRG